jgi:hypothetical protein
MRNPDLDDGGTVQDRPPSLETSPVISHGLWWSKRTGTNRTSPFKIIISLIARVKRKFSGRRTAVRLGATTMREHAALTSSEFPELPPATRRVGRRPRQEEVERLLRLMGGMLADAYIDACEIIAEQPQHRTASHLVGHLAREIDSGLRKLLVAMLPRDRQKYLEELPRDRPDSYDPPRREVIEEICAFLRVPEEADAPRVWRSLVWHDRAHRDALRVPRVLDDGFLKSWNDFVHVLLMIGRAFEASYLTATPMIDELARIEHPTKDDCNRLRNQIPQSNAALERFFVAAGSGWFFQLRRAHYFDTAEGLSADGDGMVSYVPWPPGPYLARVAAEPAYAADVVSVFKALATDNPQAGESAADVALVLRPDLAAQLAPKLAQFLESFAQWSLPSKASKVAVRLAAESQPAAALVIIERLIPVPDRGSRHKRFVPLESVAPAYPCLGVDIVRFLADRLCAADNDPDNKVDLRYSAMWRPSIAKDRYGDGRDEIVSALRDAAAAVAGSVGVARVVEILDAYEPTVFSRLYLHLLSLFPEPLLVEQRLTSPEVFHEADLDREYGVLLRQEYSRFSEPAQQKILKLIDAGPSRGASADYAAEVVERWRLHQLGRLEADLPDRYREDFEALVARYGPSADREDDDLEFTAWPGPHSPVTAAEIASMTDHDLLAMLATWQESGEWRAPTVDGLRIQLEEAMAAHPARFSRLAPQFIKVDPTYGIGLLTTLRRLVADQVSGSSSVGSNQPPAGAQQLVWSDLLDFGQALVDHSQRGSDQPSEDGRYGPTWDDCCRHLAELLTTAMRNRAIGLGHSNRVFALILQLVEDPHPDANQRVVLEDHDPVLEALSAVRALGLAGVMEFIRWALPDADSRQKPEYEMVTGLLDAHLDPANNSPGVRSVYGMYLNALLVHRAEWTQVNRDRIFGSADGTGLGGAAWQSFLRTNRPSQRGYEFLRQEYEAAVKDLPGEIQDDDDAAQTEATEHLIGHIATLYGWGFIPIDSELIATLFASRTAMAFRVRFLEICGQMLSDATEPADDVVARLQALWDWRASEVAVGNTEPQELSSFGWWASSLIIPAGWTLARLQHLLRLGGVPEPTHMVADRLLDLTPTHLAETVQCVSLLVDAVTDRWFIDRSHREITAVLTAGVTAPDTTTRQCAVDTVNRLVARGRTTFASILA